MNTRSPPPRSFSARFCWRAWFCILGFCALLRVGSLLILGHSGDSRLGMYYAGGTWVALMLVNMRNSGEMTSYFKLYHRKTWEYITHVPFFGPGGNNSFRVLPWLESQDGMEDPILAEMKINARKTLWLTLIVFCTFPIAFVLLSV